MIHSFPLRQAGRALACSLLLCAATSLAIAQDSENREGLFGPLKPPASAVAVEFPKAPQEAALQKVSVTGGSTMRFLVDLSSISVASGTVVRYVLVAQSAQGVRNVSYEGLDCAQNAWHVYGVWNAREQRWIRNPQTDWIAVNVGGFTRIHGVLDSDYLCEDGRAAGSRESIVENLKQGLHGPQPTP
ncbi:MAG: hypothetical protein KGJ76_12325 [Betaproteobacteria bacterium]|jgi:hypothetical protein|nr:hypothetical protein [Betaproteobacteria bacterium]